MQIRVGPEVLPTVQLFNDFLARFGSLGNFDGISNGSSGPCPHAWSWWEQLAVQSILGQAQQLHRSISTIVWNEYINCRFGSRSCCGKIPTIVGNVHCRLAKGCQHGTVATILGNVYCWLQKAASAAQSQQQLGTSIADLQKAASATQSQSQQQLGTSIADLQRGLRVTTRGNGVSWCRKPTERMNQM